MRSRSSIRDASHGRPRSTTSSPSGSPSIVGAMDGSRSTERLRATVRVQAFARSAARASPNPRIASAVAPTDQAATTTTIASVPTPPTTVEPPVRGPSLTPAPRSP